MRLADATGDDDPERLISGPDAAAILGTGLQRQMVEVLLPSMSLVRLQTDQLVPRLLPSLSALFDTKALLGVDMDQIVPRLLPDLGALLPAFDTTALLGPGVGQMLRTTLSRQERQEIEDAIREATELTEEVGDIDLPDSLDEVLPENRRARLVAFRARLGDTLQKLAHTEKVLQGRVKGANEAVETYSKGIQNLISALVVLYVLIDQLVK
ncbi:hypothetical protein AB1207_22515 [Kineococcus endophyticus]|uniref:Uncharacterized protein n=1 Tax=Kineococcus endophyticus TaxID=1181883 RepID=A0ABV3PD25_9ACTN